jgi:hypothetical protein
MQKLMIAALGAVSLLAAPAFAASSTSSSSDASNKSMPNADSAGTNTGAATGNLEMRTKISTDLEQQGFKNVHVIADSFLVHAENKQGQPVVMIINPDSVFSMTEMGANGASSAGSNAAPKTTASK